MLFSTEQELLQQLIQSPRLPLYARQLDDILDQETRNRQAFYQQVKEGDKAEFINGEEIFHSPVKLHHNRVSGNLYRLLSTYVIIHGLGLVEYEKLMISLTRNDYEPDICYFRQPKAAQFVPDQMRFPAPDFIVEIISPSTEANDRGIKFQDYAAHGVAEYWLVDPETETLEQYTLAGEQYQLVIKARTGIVTSIVVSGFEIPVQAIFEETLNRETLRLLWQTI